MKFLCVVTSLVFTVLVLIPDAFASGPGFSGLIANADTAETVVTNPAGMSRFKEPTGYGSPMVVYMDSDTEVTAQGIGKKQSSGDESFVAVPGFYYVKPLGERWAIGIGPNAVGGLGSSYDDNWVGRYLLKEWALSFVGIAPSASYRVNDKLSVGVSTPIMYSRYSLEKAVFNGLGTGDGSYELDADGWGVGINVGILYELTEHTRFGLNYRSKVSVSVEGSPDVTGVTEVRRQLLNQDISFDTGTPQVVAGGMFHEFQNGWSCSFDVAWVDYSEFEFEDVEIGSSAVSTRPANFNDIWATTLGVNYELTPQLTLQGGVFYISSAMDEEDHTAFMRLDQMWGAGPGIEYKYKKDRSVSFNLTYVQFGDGKFTVEDVARAGNIEGKYTKNYALVLGVGMKW